MATRRLFDTLPVDRDVVARAVSEKWNVALGDLLKASQNSTFLGTDASGAKVIVRVTPDSEGTEHQRIADELHFINYLDRRGLRRVCPPVPMLGASDAETGDESQRFIAKVDKLNIVVFQHAAGELVDFISWKWISDEVLARIWGRWTGELHALSRAYASEFPAIIARARSWDELHDSIMRGAPLAPEDVALAADQRHFGLLHGDINISNFFYIAPSADDPRGTLHVFDWDQIQRGWFLYDLVMCVYFPYMLSRAGKFLDGSVAPSREAAERFMDWVVAGYEQGLDESLPDEAPHRVDRAALDRMIELRKLFYERFCRRAIVELDEDEAKGADPKPAMRVFMTWVVDWLDREARGEIPK
ncbi:kinase-like domain-containing protein [Hyaloraphidium curvatum]|nr:kinase-like domain-containing protein [Hyaloraphidium curvatum]